MARIAKENEQWNFAEVCPHCENEIGIVCDKPYKDEFDYELVCPVCGKQLMLCTMCQDHYGGVCDWSEENGCFLSRKEFSACVRWIDEEDDE